jgi:tetratricopeptide (TPR) repeat protein
MARCTQALAQKASAERHSQEASGERLRAEGQAAQALQQKGIADERLADVRKLAQSMLFELEDQVRDLPGSTKARETLARLGMEYLNKVSEAAAEDSRLQQELGAAYLKVGDLQGEPGHSNLRDIASARNSYARSAAILEEQLKADPHNPELQHLLTVASLRKAQLEPTEEKMRSAVERVLVEPPASNGYLDCSLGCSAPVVDREAYSTGETQNERRAVAIRGRILEQGPRTAQARWELASAQIELASAVWSEYSKEGREVLRQALASLDELVLLDPANVQYKRDRGRALSLSARFEQDARRPSEAEQLGQQALALMQQVVDSDPRNAGFRLDLNNVQFMVGYLLVKNGDQAGGMKYLNQAVALQEEQAKAQPGNPDFLLQTAVFHTRFGAVGAGFTDYKAALVHQREAESIYRKLVREHPDDKAYLQRLAAQLPLVAQSIAGSGVRGDPCVSGEHLFVGETQQGVGRRCGNRLRAGKSARLLRPGFAGWTANWMVLNRLPEAIAQSRRIRRSLGERAPLKMADLVRHQFSGVAGYVCLGLLLGLLPFLGIFAGVPLEVRHITLASASLAYSVRSLIWSGGVPWSEVGWAGLGLLATGLLNFSVAFSLGLWLALRARYVGAGGHRKLITALWSELRRHPARFLWQHESESAAPDSATRGATA